MSYLAEFKNLSFGEDEKKRERVRFRKIKMCVSAKNLKSANSNETR